jgi:hypothetical protein
MKKLLAILFVLFALSSCKVPVYTMGMTETEFKAQNKQTSVVEATTTTTVYESADHFDDKQKMHYMYYYFEGSRLVRIDKGQFLHRDDLMYVLPSN